MKKYIKNLIRLINYERDAEIDLMTYEISTMSGKKREELGRAINKVKGKSLGNELGLEIVQFGRPEAIDTEISVGDMVLVSSEDPLRSDLTGTVTEKGTRFVKVAFDKRVPRWAIKKKVRLDLYANDITFRRMEDNLKHLSLKGKNALEYILKDRNPRKNRPAPYISYIDENLNSSQKSAIEDALSCENFFLIHGPFGTGKTRTLVELISQETRQNHKVLATAESNAAVEESVASGVADGVEGIARAVKRTGENLASRIGESLMVREAATKVAEMGEMLGARALPGETKRSEQEEDRKSTR